MKTEKRTLNAFHNTKELAKSETYIVIDDYKVAEKLDYFISITYVTEVEVDVPVETTNYGYCLKVHDIKRLGTYIFKERLFTRTPFALIYHQRHHNHLLYNEKLVVKVLLQTCHHNLKYTENPDKRLYELADFCQVYNRLREYKSALKLLEYTWEDVEKEEDEKKRNTMGFYLANIQDVLKNISDLEDKSEFTRDELISKADHYINEFEKKFGKYL